MSNQLQLPHDKDLARQIITHNHEIEKQKTHYGLLGKLWGDSQSVPNNISALCLIFLLMFGVIHSFCSENIEEVKNVWTIISPLITLALGYLFGDKKSKDN